MADVAGNTLPVMPPMTPAASNPPGAEPHTPPSPFTPAQATATLQPAQIEDIALMLTPEPLRKELDFVVSQPSSHQPCSRARQASTMRGWALAPVVLLAALLLEPIMQFATRLVFESLRYSLWLCWRLGLWGFLIAVILAVSYVLFKVSVGFWRVMTFKADELLLDHDCIVPDSYDHRPVVQAVTRALLDKQYPSIADIAEDGSLIAFMPGLRDSPSGAPLNAGSGQEELEQQWQQQHRLEGQQGDEAPWRHNQDVASCVAAPPPECIIVLGTSHVSKKSAEDAERVVMAVQPALVLLELDEGREGVLYRDLIEAASGGEDAKPTLLSTLQQALAGSKDEGFLKVLLQLMYAQVEEQLGTKAGLEFVAVRRAVEALKAGYEDGSMPDAPRRMHLILGDRPVKETIQAMWAGLSPRKRLVFSWQMLRTLLTLKLDEETMEKMKSDDALTAMVAELSQDFPEVMRPLLHDRNWYLAVRMWQWAQRSPPGRPLVAVVGRGHLKGIVYALKYLDNATKLYQAWLLQQDTAELQHMHEQGSDGPHSHQEEGQEGRGMFTVDSMGSLPHFDDS